MRYRLGRLLQLLGLVLVPVGIAGNVAASLTLWQSLTVSAVGIGMFLLGWLLQQGARPG